MGFQAVEDSDFWFKKFHHLDFQVILEYTKDSTIDYGMYRIILTPSGTKYSKSLFQ